MFPVLILSVAEVITRATILSRKYWSAWLLSCGSRADARNNVESFVSSPAQMHLSFLRMATEYMSLIIGLVATIMVNAQRDLPLPSSFVRDLLFSAAVQVGLEFATDVVSLVLEFEYLDRVGIVQLWTEHLREYATALALCLMFMVAIFAADYTWIISLANDTQSC